MKTIHHIPEHIYRMLSDKVFARRGEWVEVNEWFEDTNNPDATYVPRISVAYTKETAPDGELLCSPRILWAELHSLIGEDLEEIMNDFSIAKLRRYI